MTATIPRVPRPRGSLTSAQERRLERAALAKMKGEREYVGVVLDLLGEGCSFAEVSKATGLSTNTLQRWKREAAG